jgi:hypothetical protein
LSGGKVQVRLIVTILLFFMATSSHGQNRHPDAFHCTGVDNDIARLECFDEAYRDFRAASEAPGNWRGHAKANPLDDTITTALVLDASEGTKPLFDAHQLIVRCAGEELSVWIDWGHIFHDVERPEVTWRIGREKAETTKWYKSESGSSTFYPDSAVLFVRRLMEVDQFVARASPTSGDVKTAIFQVKGLADVVEPIKDPCLMMQFSPAEIREGLNNC